jgi:hypothetical protein
MTHHTPEEAEKANIAKMGDALGRQYSSIWQEVAMLHVRWAHYVELFGTKPERVDLLNAVAPLLARIIEDDLWEAMLLHIGRLTDPPRSAGKANLTLRNLPDLIDDSSTKAAVEVAIQKVIDLSGFCRDLRNRHIAHRDLALALNQPAVPLSLGSRADMKAVLKAITTVLNLVEHHYKDSQSVFDTPTQGHDSLALLRALDEGHKAHQERWQRLLSGKPTNDDFSLSDI